MNRRARLIVAAMLALIVICLTACNREAGEEKAADQQVLHFTVTGMHCDGCAGIIMDRVMELDGVMACAVSFERGEAEVTVTDRAMEQPIIAAVKELQYGIEPAEHVGKAAKP